MNGWECMGTKHFGLSGDTVIDLQTYSRLYGINHNSSTYVNVDSFVLDSASYIGGIREDSSKKVYFFPRDSASEYVLYDFALQVGDTFYMTIPWSPYQALTIVSSIDSVLVVGGYRRHWTLDNGVEWIEGIGNTIGWFNLMLIGTFQDILSCFRQNGEMVYQSLPYCSCTPVWWDAIENISEENLKLNPNPVSNTLNVQMMRSDNSKISIYNSFGQKVYDKRFSNQDQISLDVSFLPNGLYFVFLNGDQSTYKQSFIKQ
jgi:hypothetical protein